MTILTQIGRFRTVSPVWIHQCLRNDAQSLKEHRRGALLFFKVIRQISRSHGSENRRIWPKLGVSGQQLQFEFTDGYEMLHKAWNSKGEVPYCFPRSSIKFQGHTGQNITNIDPNWAFPDYRPVAAFKSLRFALFTCNCINPWWLFVSRYIVRSITLNIKCLPQPGNLWCP